MTIAAAASATVPMCGITKQPPRFCFPRLRDRCARRPSDTAWTSRAGCVFASCCPTARRRYHIAAADGQMGQIIHAYLDWKLCGDEAWLKTMWPRVKKGVEFAWIPGGWDANRDGVMDGVQHNTYDVEFYGPNPLCGIYYLGALRAAEEMGRAAGDDASANEYRRLFDQGSRWIDANLFRGEFYIQQIRGFRPDQIAPQLRSGMGSENTEQPEYQVGARLPDRSVAGTISGGHRRTGTFGFPSSMCVPHWTQSTATTTNGAWWTMTPCSAPTL